MLLRRVRIGLAVEEDSMREICIHETPAMFTPAAATPGHAPMTPVPIAAVVGALDENLGQKADQTHDEVVEQATAAMVDLEELQSVKDEMLDIDAVAQQADNISLFPQDLVSAGAIAIDSSSGSDSSSSSESSSDEESPGLRKDLAVQFSETTPDGFEFFKHKKSWILHSRKIGSDVFTCKAKVSPNFQVLPRVIRFKYPKCLKCFPRIRTELETLRV